MLSYHSEQESHDTCSAMQAFVPQPSGGREVSYSHAYQAFPHRYDEYAAHNHFAKSHSSRSDCHTPYPNINAEANLSLPSDASLQSPRWLLRAAWCRVHLRPQQLLPAGRRLLQREYCVLRRFSPYLWGLARYSPPKTRLAHGGIGRLPFEIYTAKFGTIGDKSRPNLVEQAALRPSLKSAMNRAVVRKIPGQLIPLAAASHAKDDRIQRTPRVDAFSPRVFGRIEFPDHWFYVVPQFFRHVPNCWQRLYFTFFSHLCILSISLHRCYRLNYAF
jgi:hypothetical protein